MSSAVLQLPADPAERRKLWREWTHTDAPSAERASVRRATPAVDLWAQEAIDAPRAIVAGLRQAIEDAIIDGHLSIADRERLLRRADRLGVKRFEATLLIAAVQHRSSEHRDERTVRATFKRPRRSRSVMKLVGACVGLEVIVLAALGIWIRA